jgi:hypothetical protein
MPYYHMLWRRWQADESFDELNLPTQVERWEAIERAVLDGR